MFVASAEKPMDENKKDEEGGKKQGEGLRGQQ